MRSHLDGVRDTHFISSKTMVSVSEDCLIKLWDINLFYNSDITENVDCYYTLREHTGPLFSVACYH